MAASSTQIERIKNRHLGMSAPVVSDSRPAQIAAALPKILVHRCFGKGDPKPRSCSCRERITYFDAMLLVTDKKASWLASNQRSIAIHQTRAAALESKKLRKEGLRFENSFLFKKDEIVVGFRRWLERMVRNDDLPSVVSTWNDDKLNSFLDDPELAVTACPAFLAQKPTQKVPPLYGKLVEWSKKWWENVVCINDLSEETGIYIADAKQGRGKLSSGGFDTPTIDAIRAKCFVNPEITGDAERSGVGLSSDLLASGHRKTTAANHKATEVLDENGEATGIFDFSTGQDPVAYLTEEQSAEEDFDESLEFQSDDLEQNL